MAYGKYSDKVKAKGTMDMGWDARAEFVKELVLRMHNFLDSSSRDPMGWFEALRDFYSIACPFVKDRDAIKKRIQQVKALLYAQRVDGAVVTQRQRQKNIEIAYEKIWQLYEDIYIDAFNSGIFLPLYQKPDPKKAIQNMH
jgi:hypothetical protein